MIQNLDKMSYGFVWLFLVEKCLTLFNSHYSINSLGFESSNDLFGDVIIYIQVEYSNMIEISKLTKKGFDYRKRLS